jgi:hypothetical protein
MLSPGRKDHVRTGVEVVEQRQADRGYRLVPGRPPRIRALWPHEVYKDDGSEAEYGEGDLFSIRPGHDAAVIGDKECVVLDWGQFGGYAKRS